MSWLVPAAIASYSAIFVLLLVLVYLYYWNREKYLLLWVFGWGFYLLRSISEIVFFLSGIGLTMVKKIVENYGGEIWVESEVEKGSNFIFTIPKQKGV
jgi:sensor histidine kinase YesM